MSEEWISVSERLPKGNGLVLLHAAHDSDKWITMGYRSGDGWYVIEAAEALGHHDLNRFTHWMPLPAPPTDAK